MVPQRSLRRGLITAFIAVIGAAMLGNEALAQRFQYIYGGPECAEAGRWGVTPLNDGGYLAVGETHSTDNPCAGTDIYVIRTDPTGALVWSAAYNIGEQDSATDVIVDNQGDYVICGVTWNREPCPLSRDAFLLKIDPNGNLITWNTYGNPETDEIAWNLVQSSNADGDYIVAGSTTFNAGGGRDGYIFRTDINLNLIWDRHYGGFTSEDDFFYGVIEAQISTDECNAGDIVAVGGTNTWGAGGYDVWIVRVDGTTGTPIYNATWGLEWNEEGWAIIEIRNYDAFAGDLVITGYSESRSPQGIREILMLQTRCNPCIRVADQFAGDAGELDDQGIDLKEDDFPYDATLPDVIVTGYTNLGTEDLPGDNVFLQRFAIGTMTLSGPGMVYGGEERDWGWSVNNVPDIDGDGLVGYIVAGFTQSPSLTGGDPEQLYLIKTDQNLSSGCNEAEVEFRAEEAKLRGECLELHCERFTEVCQPEIEQIDLDWQTLLCYANPSNRERGNGGSDGISGVETPAVIDFSEGSVTSYPNPITKGTDLNLRFDLATSADAGILVSDIVGRVVYEGVASVGAGSPLHAIETKGWSAGTYLVRVTIGDASRMIRVVVLDR